MLNSASATPATNPTTLFSIPKASSTSATNSFAQQLAAELAGLLNQAGDSANLEIDIKAEPRQDSGARQFLVTVRDASAGAPPSAAPVASTLSTVAPTSSPAPEAAASVSPAPAKRLANGKPVLNEADAYWATQPPAVQQLRDLPTDAARSSMAHDLADQGYLIDVPIMVWGWDPLATMIVRRNQGFTWVPSAKMDSLKVAPGISFPGLPSYDPKNPPDGAIPVTTDWAKGLESTDPWLHQGIDY